MDNLEHHFLKKKKKKEQRISWNKDETLKLNLAKLVLFLT
jgi:hypothetical protein